MASEKQTSISFRVAKGGLAVSDSVALVEDLSGTDFYAKPVTVTTSWAAVSVEELASVDLLFVKNTDATNYVQLATANDNSGIFARLTAGRGCFFPVNSGSTIYARANTASCVCNFVAVEP